MSEEIDTMRIIHYALVDLGFKRSASPSTEEYIKNFEINGVIFPIRIILHDPFFVTKPSIILEEKPESLSLNIPHLFLDKHLCYLDDTGAEFDRYSPHQNISIVYSSLLHLLEQYAKEPKLLQEEFRRELPAYWKSEFSDYAFFSAEDADNLIFEYFERNDLKGNSLNEFIISDSPDTVKTWKAKRSQTGKVKFSGKALLIELPEDISFNLDEWPPNCFSDLEKWLSEEASNSTSQRFVSKLFSIISKESACFIVLKLNEMLLGVMLNYSQKNNKKIIREKFKTHKVVKRGKKTPIQISPSRMKALIRGLEKNEKNKGFSRLNVSDARPATIHTRNLVDQVDLSKLKIAVIGCGTVGGYAASLLYQAGAGTRGGNLSLFDYDILDTENLGRHYLGVQYLDENKAEALSNELIQLSGNIVNILAIPTKFPSYEIQNTSEPFDLIIDTTGDINFSNSLCHNMHRTNKPVPIIYAWVDAGGLAARALLDEVTPSKACYVCLKERQSDRSINERFPLIKKGQPLPSWIPKPCGIGGYLPFSTQASISAAGLAQSLSLDWVNKSATPHFRHLSLDKRVRHTKSGDIKPLKNCPCCQK